MTEDEAKSMACCGPRNNSAAAEDSDVLCIGSRCMAWRWYGTHAAIEGSTKLRWTTRTYGCCGLAGPWFLNEDRKVFQ